MGAISNPMQPAAVRQLTLVRKDTFREAHASTEGPRASVDDGLGCFRGLAVAMFCNLILGLMVAAGWGLWRLLR